MKKVVYLTFLSFSFVGLAQTTTENFIKTTVYNGPNNTLPVTSVTYFDGLGRPIQQVAGQQSASGQDIVTHIQYDAFGRQLKEFLPYTKAGTTLAFDANGLAATQGFYNSTQVQDPTMFPFSEKQFEASPLNRVIKQAAPGDSWKLGSNNEIKLVYQTNTATEVKNFVATALWDAQKQLYEIGLSMITTNGGFYQENQLYKNITYDENANAVTTGNTIEEFKDKEGRVVLKRTYNNYDKHDTYYVYDIFGNLTYVLPPLANGLITPDILTNLCYQYKYDYRNRLVEKKLPGKQWEFIVYDKLDRVIATGPANAPFQDLIDQGKTGWMVTKYDVFNRPVYTAWEMAKTPITATVRTFRQNNHNSATTINESKVTSNTIDGKAVNYTNAVAPTTLKILTINYYDDYNYANAPTNFATPLLTSSSLEQNYNNSDKKPKGMPTGGWVRVLDNSTLVNGETSYMLYDYKARPIHTKTTNYLGGYTQVETKLDFMGKTLFSETRHKRSASVPEILVREDFTYTTQDRLLTHSHKVNNNPTQVLAVNEYTELGQLKTKQVGGQSTQPRLQKVDYTYNIRGWLTGINDINNLTPPLGVGGPKDLFSFQLAYNNPKTATPLFNGNISETYWRTASDNKLRKYGYAYDHLNRLLNATYNRPEIVPTPNAYGENLAYDKNGNITYLSRNGDFDDAYNTLQIDNLSYTYDPNSNQLLKVTDSSNSQSGFKDDAEDINDQSNDYSYDDNGNMTRDENKKIVNISYNHLNLPTKIIFATNEKIHYIYNAVGQKIFKKIEYLNMAENTEYVSGFDYQNSVLQYFATAEGYVRVTDGKFNYVYNYTDHLGNVRLSYGLDTTNVLTILEENNYYPFGLKHKNYNMSEKIYYKTGAGIINLGTTYIGVANNSKKYNYKYNGKELQDELGLNLYDYGARNYDPALGRWMNIDPLAEKYFGLSSYAYCLDNPISNYDPDGMDVYFVNEQGNFTLAKKEKGNDRLYATTKDALGFTQLNHYGLKVHRFGLAD